MKQAKNHPWSTGFRKFTADYGVNLGRMQSAKTHCSRGHEFTEANTGRRRSGRYCRQCKAMNERKDKAP